MVVSQRPKLIHILLSNPIAFFIVHCAVIVVATLQNYDSDDNGTPKSNRFNEQNNNSARASRFFVHFFAALHNYDVK